MEFLNDKRRNRNKKNELLSKYKEPVAIKTNIWLK